MGFYFFVLFFGLDLFEVIILVVFFSEESFFNFLFFDILVKKIVEIFFIIIICVKVNYYVLYLKDKLIKVKIL